MRKLKFLCLLATLWLMVGGCKKKDECGEEPATYGHMRMTIEDDLGRNYQAAKQLPIGSIVWYDANLNYATAYGGMVSWEQEKNRYFGDFNEMYVDFASKSEATGIMHSKIFYIKLGKDVDTLSVDYKIEDKCMRTSNFKAFYNGNPIHTALEATQSATYYFKIIKK
jgi:hypothetical protein